MTYPSELPHDDYPNIEDINTTEFEFLHTTTDGVRVKVKYSEENGETITLPDGTVLNDATGIFEYMQGKMVRFFDACQEERQRLTQLKAEMVQRYTNDCNNTADYNRREANRRI